MAHAESLLLGNKEQNKCKTNQSIKTKKAYIVIATRLNFELN
jgi:hypothetical protein